MYVVGRQQPKNVSNMANILQLKNTDNKRYLLSEASYASYDSYRTTSNFIFQLTTKREEEVLIELFYV